MPRFSVIVPVFKVQGFLRECLDSVLEQSYRDIEVIAVDDCSPDGCGAILDEYADRTTASGCCTCRRTSASAARATPECRTPPATTCSSSTATTPSRRARCARWPTGWTRPSDPDVLVFDYARTYWWGGTRRNVLAHVLADACDGASFDGARSDGTRSDSTVSDSTVSDGTRSDGTRSDGTFTASERPEILDLLMVVWNKLYRRDFVERAGFAFPPGYYEDTPWTFPVLLSAARIAALDRICLDYRQRRQGTSCPPPAASTSTSTTSTSGSSASSTPAPRSRVGVGICTRKMGEHCLDVLAKPDRLPPSAKAEFFRRTAELFREHRPAGTSVAPELRVLEGGYPAYVAKRQAGRAGRELARRARAARRAAGARLTRGRSTLGVRRAPVPDLVLYSAFSHQGVLGDPAAIYHKAREIAPHLRGVWVVRDEETARAAQLPPDVEYVLLGSPRCRRLAARAAYFVNNANWPGSLPGHPGSVHLHTHQGTPLKYMGVDLLDKPGARYGLDVPQMLRRADRWDYSLVANPHSELVWERAYPCHFTSLRTGSPRNDVLVQAGPAHTAAVRARLGIPADHRVVLYAPTRRDYRRGGHVDRIDLARFAEDLGPGHTLVVRLHPTLADGPARGLGLAELHRRGALVDATDEPHVEDVMLAADVLVTDYSALMFDYAHLDRPIIVHADDWGAYTASRGAYFDITAEPPGHVSRSYRELAWLFASGTWRDEESARLRSGFRERFCAYDDGHAAERVVRTVLLGGSGWMPGPATVGPPPARSADRDVLTSS